MASRTSEYPSCNSDGLRSFAVSACVLILALFIASGAHALEFRLSFSDVDADGAVLVHAAAPEPLGTVLAVEEGESANAIASRVADRISALMPELDVSPASEGVIVVAGNKLEQLSLASTTSVNSMRACVTNETSQQDLSAADDAYEAEDFKTAYDGYYRHRHSCEMTGKRFARLGILQYRGRGTDVDRQAAAMSFDIGAALGSRSAKMNLGRMLYFEDTLAANDHLSRGLLTGAAEEGSNVARLLLVGLIENARGGPRDDDKALAILTTCANDEKTSNTRTRCRKFLGASYKDGHHGQSSFDEAERWLQLAANDGDVQARGWLAVLYHAAGLPEQALAEFTIAAEGGDAQAQHNLGFLYQEGEVVERDLEAAKYWYRLSAEQGYADAVKKLERLGE